MAVRLLKTAKIIILSTTDSSTKGKQMVRHHDAKRLDNRSEWGFIPNSELNRPDAGKPSSCYEEPERGATAERLVSGEDEIVGVLDRSQVI